tara:strand:+ start:1285 stop:1563 length:279 start_codon:yes stop_codon:yes gene_type:complete
VRSHRNDAGPYFALYSCLSSEFELGFSHAELLFCPNIQLTTQTSRLRDEGSIDWLQFGSLFWLSKLLAGRSDHLITISYQIFNTSNAPLGRW